MGFLDMMKRAMGFTPADDDELEVEGIDATVTPLRQRGLPPAGEPSRELEDEPGMDGNCEEEPSMADGARQSAAVEARPDASVIFEGVVGMFNEALPSFIRESVDPQKQRQLLFDALDTSIKDYFDRLEKNVERRLHGRYQAESRKLQEQIEELRQKARKEEEGNSNAKNLQLSAERQKRALSERVHELEKQLASIEAENEQYILENKSMANKLRMAAMSDRDIDASCQEILDREKALSAREEELKAREAQLDEQARGVAASQKEADRKLAEAAASEESAKVVDLEKEVAALRDSLEQAKAKDELSRAMVNDLNSKAAEARRIAAEKEELSASLQASLSTANEQVAQLTARLGKAHDDLQVVREVQEQVRLLEEKQLADDARMRRQQDELMEKDELIRAKDADLLTKNTTLRIKDETIRRLEDQTDSLRKSVEAAQFEKSQTESALRSEIERLKGLKGIAVTPAQVSVDATEPAVEVEIPEIPVVDTSIDLTLDLPELVTPEAASISVAKPRRGRPPKARQVADGEIQAPAPERKKVARTDDDDSDLSLLDSTDWLIANPVPETAPKPKRQRKQKTEQADDAFGYKEPVRQEPPDNPAQMLLW